MSQQFFRKEIEVLKDKLDFITQEKCEYINYIPEEAGYKINELKNLHEEILIFRDNAIKNLFPNNDNNLIIDLSNEIIKHIKEALFILKSVHYNILKENDTTESLIAECNQNINKYSIEIYSIRYYKEKTEYSVGISKDDTPQTSYYYYYYDRDVITNNIEFGRYFISKELGEILTKLYLKIFTTDYFTHSIRNLERNAWKQLIFNYIIK